MVNQVKLIKSFLKIRVNLMMIVMVMDDNVDSDDDNGDGDGMVVTVVMAFIHKIIVLQSKLRNYTLHYKNGGNFTIT